MFRGLLGGLTGGPSVETELQPPATRPGEVLRGVVRLAGGEAAARIEHVTVSLATRVEVESGDHEWSEDRTFGHLPVAGATELAPGQKLELPFALPVPWETPLTAVAGQHLRRPTVGLRTEVAIARALDKGDLDPVAVHALPVQERALDALLRLGFRFTGADVERGRVPGSTLPFYQEFEFRPGPRYARGMNELEVTFIVNARGVRILLEADRRGGFFTPGYDAYAYLDVDHTAADSFAWEAELDTRLAALGRRRGLF